MSGTKRNEKVSHNKIILKETEIQFIRDNHGKMTNQELADALGLKLTKLRGFCYEMGLYHQKLEYWTLEQVNFLKDNYREKGDTELAEIFEVKWYKEKGWTKKHIEKKRRYLKLKRTSKEMKAIKARNTAMGRFAECVKKRWETTGQLPIGEKRIWFTVDNHPFVVIKTKHGFVHYNRWLWEKHKGDIPTDMNVCIKEGSDIINYGIEDLHLLTNGQLAIKNSRKRTPKELMVTNKLIKKIERIINKSNTYEQHP